MSTVTHEWLEATGEWADCLDGLPLHSNDALEVTFPDGSYLQLLATVMREMVTVYEAGTKLLADRYRGYLSSNYRGVAVMVPLCGLRARWL